MLVRHRVAELLMYANTAIDRMSHGTMRKHVDVKDIILRYLLDEYKTSCRCLFFLSIRDAYDDQRVRSECAADCHYRFARNVCDGKEDWCERLQKSGCILW